VAVFENQTGDPSLDPVGRMAQDWITQGLAQTGLVDVVPTTAALQSYRYVEAESGAPQGLDRVRALAEETGAGTVVWGAYYRQGESIQFQAQITDAAQRKLLSALDAVSGPLESPLEGIELLRQRVMGVLGELLNPRLGPWATEARQPPTFEAYNEYAEGAEHFFRRDYREALQHFYQAAALDSTYVVPLSHAVVAHMNLGEYAQAESLANVVNRSREQLSPAMRSLQDWHDAMLRGDWAGTLRAARQAAELAPAWAVAHYAVALSALRVNRPREAVEVLERIDPERGAMRGWVPYWSVLTAAHHVLGDHRRELEMARRGRRQYPDLLSTLSYEVEALAALGRVAELSERLDESFTLPPQSGWTPAGVMRRAAIELRAHGHPEAAREVLERAIAWYRARPSDEAATRGRRYGLARALYLAEQWGEAQSLFEGLAAERPESLNYKGYLGVLAARRGEREGALRIEAQLRRLDRPYLFGDHTYWRACIAALLGERERALSLLRDAFAQGVSYGAYLHAEYDLEPLRDHQPFQELLRPKG
ncbi:MAG: hypothetical protein JSV86_06145, partial [Gemmatimonadota bacterium]